MGQRPSYRHLDPAYPQGSSEDELSFNKAPYPFGMIPAYWLRVHRRVRGQIFLLLEGKQVLYVTFDENEERSTMNKRILAGIVILGSIAFMGISLFYHHNKESEDFSTTNEEEKQVYYLRYNRNKSLDKAQHAVALKYIDTVNSKSDDIVKVTESY